MLFDTLQLLLYKLVKKVKQQGSLDVSAISRGTLLTGWDLDYFVLACVYVAALRCRHIHAI
ncbi:hypothetical protein BZZ01_06210 [Nostocales cyanobacterium HT-58-2]|nr:hypothetical protein BZZ01_06210 [Nostocales cyanobacterium HT-58-2]